MEDESYRQRYRGHTLGATRYRRRKNPFWRGFVRGLGALSDLNPRRFNPPRYPQDARLRDQERIGHDMYRAMGIVNEEAKAVKPHAA